MNTALVIGLMLAQQETGTRSLWDTTFLSQRPATKKAGPAKTPTAVPAKPAANTAAFVGVTIWRLRPSLPTDEMGSRLFLHDEQKKEEQWTLERASADAALNDGQRVRLSIETAQSGYLYVIDREQYASGALGEPYLIFPTTKLRGGDNAVSAGLLVEIPGREDSPPYIWLKRSRDYHVGEVLTILVTPKPLDGVVTADGPQVLSAQKVESWIKQWGARVERLDAASLAGKVYTAQEFAASRPAGTPLGPSDPAPQTLFRVDSRPGDPVVVTLPLRIAR